MKIKCIVIDDEHLARVALVDYIDQVDALELAGVFKNAIQANDFLQQNEVDLLFLDIEMPQLNGLQFLRILNKKMHVIFTTAYSKFALDSFEFDVIDYLLKPISFDRFLQAVNKSLRFISKSEAPEQDQYLFLKEGQVIKKVVLSEIIFVETMQNYVRINTEHGTIMVLMPLKELLGLLPEAGFAQTHRSFVVNMNKISSVEEDTVWLSDKSLPISKRMKAAFLKRLKKG